MAYGERAAIVPHPVGEAVEKYEGPDGHTECGGQTSGGGNNQAEDGDRSGNTTFDHG